ncbi:MAG: radical SAM protein [Candidatus Heimdallarchaeota archaeon]|nr:radical SAM protein [Candidatus Heimdallarchaeota archaeon]
MYKTLTPPLTSIHWDITNSCNFKCNFCLNNSGSLSKNELSKELCFSLIDEASRIGVRFIRFLGGEPFFHKEILNIIEYAINKGMLLQFSTNASLITSNVAKFLENYKEWITFFQISLYGINYNDYKTICGNGNFFEKVLIGIKNITDIGIKPVILSVFSKNNINKFRDFYNIARKYNPKSFRIVKVEPFGRGNSLEFRNECFNTGEFYNKVSECVKDINVDLPIEICDYRLAADFFEEKLPINVVRLSCAAALSEIYVSPTGNCRPCPFTSVNESLDKKNIFPNKSLEEIWLSESFSLFRKLHKKVQQEDKHKNCIYLKEKLCNPCPLGRSCLEKIQETSLES